MGHEIPLYSHPPQGLNATSTSRVAAAPAMSVAANRRRPVRPSGQ